MNHVFQNAIELCIECSPTKTKNHEHRTSITVKLNTKQSDICIRLIAFTMRARIRRRKRNGNSHQSTCYHTHNCFTTHKRKRKTAIERPLKQLTYVYGESIYIFVCDLLPEGMPLRLTLKINKYPAIHSFPPGRRIGGMVRAYDIVTYDRALHKTNASLRTISPPAFPDSAFIRSWQFASKTNRQTEKKQTSVCFSF